jgi:hypothetical protein
MQKKMYFVIYIATIRSKEFCVNLSSFKVITKGIIIGGVGFSHGL